MRTTEIKGQAVETNPHGPKPSIALVRALGEYNGAGLQAIEWGVFPTPDARGIYCGWCEKHHPLRKLTEKCRTCSVGVCYHLRNKREGDVLSVYCAGCAKTKKSNKRRWKKSNKRR